MRSSKALLPLLALTCLLHGQSSVSSGITSGIQTIINAGTLTYYLQNSIVASGTYTSGGSITGSAADTCTLTAFNGGGTGATATVALTGSNVIAGGTALVITAAGTQYTSASTSATLGNGTATCSGTATIATILNVPPSDVASTFPMPTKPYNPKTTMAYTINTGSGTSNEQTWITPAGSPGITFIPSGQYNCHLHISRNNSFSGTAVAQCIFEEVDASGNFIATIGTTEPTTTLPIPETEYTLEFSDGNVYQMASATSRIAMVLQLVQTTVGVAGVLDVYVGGEANPNISLPSNTVDASTFVPYTGAVKALALGSNTIQSGAVATDPGCTTTADVGKLWFNTTTTTTVMNVCLNVAGSLTWVVK